MLKVYNQLMAQGGMPKTLPGITHDDWEGLSILRPTAIRIQGVVPFGEIFAINWDDLYMPYDHIWMEASYEHQNFAVQIYLCEDKKCPSYHCAVFLDHPSSGVCAPGVDIELERDGSRLISSQGYISNKVHSSLLPIIKTLENHAICMIFHTLSLLSCKNVKLKKAPLAKVKPKKGKKQLFSYHVLDVPTPTTRYEEPSEASGRTQRLHLCRGHFATYTEDKPLFGK